MATNWRIYGQDTVACKLSKGDLPGFLRKQIIVGPHEAAIVVKDGRVEGVVTEDRLQIADFWDTVADWFRWGLDADVYFVDLGPIDFSIYVGETSKENVSVQGKGAEAQQTHGGLSTVDLISASRRIGWLEEVGGGSESTSTTTGLDVTRVCMAALSLDREVIRAECSFRVRIDVSESLQFVSLMRGKVALSRWDIAALVRDGLLGNVLIPAIASYRADDLRGNRNLLGRLEQDVRAHLAGPFGSCGLTLETFAIQWGLTDQEIVEIDRKRQQREEDALRFTHGRMLVEMQRRVEIEKTRVANLQQIKVAEAQGQEEIKELYLAAQIHRELIAEGKRVDVAKVDAQVRQIQLDVDKCEAQLRILSRREEELLRLEIEDREMRQKNAARLTELEADDKEMWSMVRMQIQLATAKHDREMATRRQEADHECRRLQAEVDRDFQQRKMRLDEDLARLGVIKDMVSLGIEKGTANAGTLSEMMSHLTEQAFATGTDEKVRARSEAVAAQHNLEAFRQAEDRERQHQRDMTALSTDMMQASKQTPGPTVVMGAGAIPLQPSGATPNVNIVNVPEADTTTVRDPARVQRSVAPAAARECPSCGERIQATWKACPICGTRLTSTCGQCGAEVQDAWKVCPNCGAQLRPDG